MQLRRVIISGGGTGGHIFPALAIADGLKEKYPGVEIKFVGALGKMEMERVPKAGYDIVGLDIQGLKRSFSLDNLKFPIKVMNSIAKSRKLLNEFQPQLAIGVGGYASGPLLFAATRKKIKTLIQEQNSYAGITNKILGKSVDKICIAYPEAKKYFPAQKVVLTGNPVRQNIHSNLSQAEAKSKLGFSVDKPTLLVIGGSLGALKINQCLFAQVQKFCEQGYQVYWQCGKRFFENRSDELKSLEQKVNGLSIAAFIDDMATAYKAADLVVSRAGALAIAEIQALGKASILVPSPFVAENHQFKNAMTLVNKQAAKLVDEHQVEEELLKQAKALLQNPDELKRLEKNVAETAISSAVDKIISCIETLLNE
ncbi:MAG: undecaprenyldiphospho-muramoylpentapeptide beta-N-acetylglucosaminyltransferase [Luteibaculum sp.]